MEQRRCLLLALALLPAIPLSEYFKVTAPQNVLGIIGQDTILPCTISSTKPLDNPKVKWVKTTDGHTEDIYTRGQPGGEPMQKYPGRTSVPGDGFATGNMSLTLRNVQPADEGRYICSVESSVWFAENDTKLRIAGAGEVFVEVLGPQGQGLELGCRSHGWFPKPTVQWVTEDGQGLPGDTEIHQDSEKLFSVRSRVTVTGEQVGEVTCQIRNPLLQVEKKTTVSLSGAGEVFVEVLGPQGQGLELGCRSHGWFPKPTVQWVTEDGQGLPGDTEIHQDSEKLFSVWSRVTVTGEQVGEVTCQIRNPLLQVEKKTTALVSGDASPPVSLWPAAFWTILTLFLFTLAVVAVLLFRERTGEANTTGGLKFMWQKDLQQLSQQIQTLQQDFQIYRESTQHDLQLLRTDLENIQGRTEEENTTQALESRLEKDLQQLSQQIQTLQENFQNMQESTQCDLQMIRKDLENKQGRMEEANTTQALESRLEKDLQQLSQQIQTLQEYFQNMQESTQCDLQMIRTDMEKKQAVTEEGNTTTIMESMWKKDLQQISHQVQNLQQDFHNMQVSTQRDLQLLRTDLENKEELSRVQSYKGDVTLDADTAHPRLEISADGKIVKDTGVIRDVASNEKRFDSHLFVLAKEGYTSGRHYWEADVGRRRSWALGIARESVTRKGPLTLSPQNGFWAIGLADGRDYWAYTDRWTRLSVSRNLHKIGIFLNIPAKKLRFYNARTGAPLYSFSIADGSSQEGKFVPFFSTGPATEKPDPEPLLIVQDFDDDGDYE